MCFKLDEDKERGLYTLYNNKGVYIKVLKSGAELIGLKFINSSDGLLYRDSDTGIPAEGWKNHATVLFPVVGRLKNSISKYNNKIIKFTKNHGLARYTEFKPVKYRLKKENASILLEMKSDNETKESYPFDFKFSIMYKIYNKKLKVIFRVKNLSKEEPLFFSLGWHPGFAVKGKWNLLVKSNIFNYYEVADNGLLTGKMSRINKDYFYKLIKSDLKKAVVLGIDDKKKRKIEFNNGKENIILKFQDFEFLGIWSEDSNKFICIEPWQGTDDFVEQKNFNEKLGIVNLKPGAEKKFKVTVKIK